VTHGKQYRQARASFDRETEYSPLEAIRLLGREEACRRQGGDPGAVGGDVGQKLWAPRLHQGGALDAPRFAALPAQERYL